MVDELVFATEDVSAAKEAQAEFERLAAEWKQETAHLSSMSMIAEHGAYQEIIRMGKEAIPLILQDLEEIAGTVVFGAQVQVSVRTRESPVARDEDRGDVEAMTAAWLDWGRNRRYI